MHNLALLSKEGRIAMIVLQSDSHSGSTMIVDPRQQVPQISDYLSQEEAIDRFEEAIYNSQNNGWTLVHIGKPNYG